jgi:pimeloyl-ACP methyl ester carboxylesterase
LSRRAAPAEGFLRVNGLNLRYLDWGGGSLPVVMLHGLRGYAETWQSVAEPLPDRFRPLALDQRGRGGSDWGRWQSYGAGQYVADLEVLVDQLGLGRFVLIGHSMGGTNAIVYTARHPERVAALVIEDMGPGASTGSAGSSRIKGELGGTPDSFASWSEAEAYWRAQRPHAPVDAVQSRLKFTLRERPDGRIAWRYDLEGIRRARMEPALQIDLWPYVADLRCPTLVIRGAASDFLARATAEEMARRNANLRWVEIDGASHYVHDDNLPAFNRVLGQFLEAAR